MVNLTITFTHSTWCHSPCDQCTHKAQPCWCTCAQRLCCYVSYIGFYLMLCHNVIWLQQVTQQHHWKWHCQCDIQKGDSIKHECLKVGASCVCFIVVVTVHVLGISWSYCEGHFITTCCGDDRRSKVFKVSLTYVDVFVVVEEHKLHQYKKWQRLSITSGATVFVHDWPCNRRHWSWCGVHTFHFWDLHGRCQCEF